MKHCFFLFVMSILSYGVHAQYICYTEHNLPNMLSGSEKSYSSHDGPYHLRVFFHFIKKTDGTGEYSLSETDITLCMSTLNEDFSSQNIYFHLAGYDYICNSIFYNLTSWNDNMYNQVTSTNAHADAIDVYLLPTNSLISGGRANGIPGNALVIGGSMDGCVLGMSHVLSHEMGHCLGLFHTFHGTYYGEADSNTCQELVNETNCSSCGDYVCDTPADPFPLFSYALPTACTWINNDYYDANHQYYAPDTRQIMAYVSPVCMEHFSDGQGERMRAHIATQQILINCQVPTVAYVQNRTFTGNDVEYINAIDSIVAGSSVTNTQTIGDVVIENGKKVVFEAGRGIRLEKGFFSRQGSYFTTLINLLPGNTPNRHLTIKHANNTSDYTPLLEDNKSWFSVMYGFEPPVEGYISSIIGDTVISAQTYYVMNEVVAPLGEDMANSFQGKYFLREDIATARVYQYVPDFGEERLLYDFSLSTGDTLPIQPRYVLRDIKEEYNITTKRKNYIFTNYYNDSIVWIEGIGNYSNPLQPFAVKLDNISKIICVEKNGGIVYDSGSFRDWITCENRPETDIPQLQCEKISIYPTITDKYISINGNTYVDSYSIYDVNGKQVLSGGCMSNIDVSSLASGMYVIILRAPTRQHSFRFIKL